MVRFSSNSDIIINNLHQWQRLIQNLQFPNLTINLTISVPTEYEFQLVRVLSICSQHDSRLVNVFLVDTMAEVVALVMVVAIIIAANLAVYRTFFHRSRNHATETETGMEVGLGESAPVARQAKPHWPQP